MSQKQDQQTILDLEFKTTIARTRLEHIILHQDRMEKALKKVLKIHNELSRYIQEQ